VQSFDFPPFFASVPWFDKYMLQAILSVILILAFWLIMARKNAMVPSKGQFIGETAYFFVRNTIARDMIGHDFRRYLPLLMALFSFVLVNNLFGVFPFLLLPTPSHVGWPYGLAIMVWVIYNGIGISKFGLFGYLKNTSLPAGVPVFMWPLIIPLEFISNIIVRPITLTVRLAANFLAGHFLLAIFFLGTYFFLKDGPKTWLLAGVSFPFAIVLVAFEVFVAGLQAFIFAILSASYIGQAKAEEH